VPDYAFTAIVSFKIAKCVLDKTLDFLQCNIEATFELPPIWGQFRLHLVFSCAPFGKKSHLVKYKEPSRIPRPSWLYESLPVASLTKYSSPT
jgi:hypothetical protein